MEPLLSPSIPQSQNPELSLQCLNFKVEDEHKEIKPEIKRETPENLTSSSIKSEPTIIKVEANGQLPQGEMIKAVFVGGKTWFRCAICSYKSKWKPPVEKHLVVHSDQKPYACPIGSCKYRSKWPECVKHHARVVHRFDLTRKVKLEVNNESSR